MIKVAVITGAAGGIGQAVSENFIKQDYRVALVDLSKDKLLEQANKLSHIYQLTADKRPLIFDLDVSDKNHVKAAIEKVLAKYKRIDVLFNGAGVARIGGSSMSHKDFEQIVKVNLFGTFNFIHEVVPVMKQQASGYIFNVASRQGKMGGANLAGYASSKFGVVGLSESILKELINTGIKVTALCPSYTDTQMMDILDFPREEMLSSEDIVKAVNFLLSLSAPACIREMLIEIRKLVG